MQGLSDGYFIVPYTIGNYLASNRLEHVDPSLRGISCGLSKASRIGPVDCCTRREREPVDSFHRELGKLVWDHCGMSRNASGLADGDRENS
jgi:succinate dehydrogenase / fumarate reductase flavoprotein subunit